MAQNDLLPDTLRIISEGLSRYAELGVTERLALFSELRKVARMEQSGDDTAEPDSTCPVTQEPLRRPCGLTQCQYYVEHPWARNCALNYQAVVNQDVLGSEQVAFLYRKSPSRVESIYKRCFKIVQRHHLRNTLGDKQKELKQFKYVPGFCVFCETRLDLADLSENLSLGNGFGYCSTECKKEHPPEYFEIESFFGVPFLDVVREGGKIFNFYYLEEILGFQPNVLRNRIETLRMVKKKL